MNTDRSRHGFTDVDSQGSPHHWIDVLDKVSREPFCVAYRSRVRELLCPRRGGHYLDIGAGTGDFAMSLAEKSGAESVGIDSSFTMAQESRSRGLEISMVATADSLPFADGRFDGCSAIRVFQHLAEPVKALAESARILKPSGRLVVIDPDYDTQVMEFPDQELAKRVFRFRADVGLRNGTQAHRMPSMFAEAGLIDIYVEPMTMVLHDHKAHDNAMGLRSWARSAYERGYLDEQDTDRWEQMFDEIVRQERFMYSVTFYLTAGRKQ